MDLINDLITIFVPTLIGYISFLTINSLIIVFRVKSWRKELDEEDKQKEWGKSSIAIILGIAIACLFATWQQSSTFSYL